MASRQWNIANNALYIDDPTARIEKETLTPVQQLNEYIMISLRTMEGCDLDHVAQRFGDGEARTLRLKMETYVRGGNAIDDGRRLLLTREGKLLADGISADLFL